MPSRTARLRQLPDGHFEFTEPVRVPAPEFDVTFEEPAAKVSTAAAAVNLPQRDVTVLVDEITRADIYGDPS